MPSPVDHKIADKVLGDSFTGSCIVTAQEIFCAACMLLSQYGQSMRGVVSGTSEHYLHLT